MLRLLWTLCLLPACAAPRVLENRVESRPQPASLTIIGLDPSVRPAWRQRPPQAFLARESDGAAEDWLVELAGFQAEARALGLETSGAPFALVPGVLAPGEPDRPRLCLPVARRPQRLPPGARFEELPASMVAYVRVGSGAAEIEAAHRTLLGCLREHDWSRSGELRLVLLAPPGTAGDEPTLEIQQPWRAR